MIKIPRPNKLYIIPLLALLVVAGSVHAVPEAKHQGLRSNEAGQIMVLMYHGIGAEETRWIRHRDNFLNDLKALYKTGYRPISLKDLINNHVTIEAGYTPIVLTFDDGRVDNFRIVKKNGKPVVDPTSAVGILEQFHKKHPDFGLEATFFLYGKYPFGQEQWLRYKLNYLIAKGMDIGNHTLNHNNLKFDRYQSAARIQHLIGAQALFLEKNLTKHPNYRVNTYALCNGRRPKNTELRKHLVFGEYQGHKYNNVGITKVGGGPSPSPATKDFQPFSIPRIRASNMMESGTSLSTWIRHFDRHPELRYVSDGNPNRVTVPKRLEAKIDPDKLQGASVVLYDDR
jgi:hypothetical protein